jgi:hypothetical protein
MKPYRGPPMTLGAAAAAQGRLIVWCRGCQHQVEPEPGEMAARYVAENASARLTRGAGRGALADPRVSRDGAQLQENRRP